MNTLSSAEGVIKCATDLTAMMQSADFDATFQAKVREEGEDVAPHPPILLAKMEVLMEERLVLLGYERGEEALAVLKNAVKKFPGQPAVRQSIMDLCSIEEKLLEAVQKERAAKLGIPLVDPAQHMQLMKDAMMSLPQEKRDAAQRIQMKMMTQKIPPTPEEQELIKEIQQHVQAYMMTMMEMMQMTNPK